MTSLKYYILLLLSLFTIKCTIIKKAASDDYKQLAFNLDTMTIYDDLRDRNIPIAIYSPKNIKNSKLTPIIFSHGYGENKGGDYLYAYTNLTEFLVGKGYFVVSIQHELDTDEPLAMHGPFQETRRPNWDRGVKNILFVLQELKKNYPNVNYEALSLIGHSNGGDLTSLFTHQYPNLVSKMITMDNRRFALPKISKPQVFSLRSNYYPADEGVLPSESEIKEYGMQIDFTNINHSHMDNDANKIERIYITETIRSYLTK